MEKAKVFLLLQSIVCILTVLMLSAAAVGVYRDGKARKTEDPTAYIYTPEVASSAASGGVRVLFLGLGLTISGLLFGIRDEKADKPVNDTECLRDMACSRVVTPSARMKEERMLQEKLKKAGWTVFFVCMIPVLIYLLNPAHFAQSSQEGLEQVIGSMVLHILPWIVIGFGFLISSTIQQERCMKRECEAASARSKEEKEAGISPAGPDKPEGMSEEKLKKIRLVVLALAIIFIIAGIANGNMHAVMVKAINICTECVGLG
jgi:hypothetical protein